VKKVVKNRRFLAIFSTKTRYCFLDSLDRGTKVWFKVKYNSYMLRIQVLKKNIWSGWGDIRFRTWNFEDSQKTQLIKGTLKTFHVQDRSEGGRGGNFYRGPDLNRGPKRAKFTPF
jgi:hypothetical protein